MGLKRERFLEKHIDKLTRKIKNMEQQLKVILAVTKDDKSMQEKLLRFEGMYVDIQIEGMRMMLAHLTPYDEDDPYCHLMTLELAEEFITKFKEENTHYERQDEEPAESGSPTDPEPTEQSSDGRVLCTERSKLL